MHLWNAQINLRQILCLLCCLLFVANGLSYKFLGVLHFSSKSHYIVGSSLMRNLVEQGHEVTVISPFTAKKPMKNFHDVHTPSVFQVMESESIINYHYIYLFVFLIVLLFLLFIYT